MRYLVFAFDDYYPHGGISDLVGNSTDLEEAEAIYDQHKLNFDNVYTGFFNDTGDFIYLKDSRKESNA